MAHAQHAFVNFDDRGDERVKVRLSIRIDLGSGLPEACTVQDISASGFLIETDVAPQGGVLVHLPDRSIVPATVVWSGERFFGCRFESLLPQSIVDQLSQASPVVWPRFARQSHALRSPAELRMNAAERVQEPSAQDVVGPVIEERKEQRMSPRASMLVIAASAVLSWGVLAACVVPLM